MTEGQVGLVGGGEREGGGCGVVVMRGLRWWLGGLGGRGVGGGENGGGMGVVWAVG